MTTATKININAIIPPTVIPATIPNTSLPNTDTNPNPAQSPSSPTKTQSTPSQTPPPPCSPPPIADYLSQSVSLDFAQILAYVEGYELLAIDEAQEIPQVGKALKIIVDQVPGIQVIVTGSSSFELAGQTGEPLTGRKRTLILYPLSQAELLARYNHFELRENLEDFLIYGSYPEVIEASTREEKIRRITEIANSYLLKDLLAFDRVRNSRTLLDLLRLLAFQVGSEVSVNELARQLGMAVKTLQRYLDLLEKAFVIFRLGGFSRDLRKEVTSTNTFAKIS